MKPYIGILIDSFWEAAANKVLWILLIGWGLVLLGLAPFGYVTDRSYRLTRHDIDSRSELIDKLDKALNERGSASAIAVAENLDEEFAEQIRAAADKESTQQKRLQQSDLAKGLNKVLLVNDLYSKDAFPTAHRRKRLEPLIEVPAEERSEAEVEELNRELLQLAFPAELNRPLGEQVWIGYAGFKLTTDPLGLSLRSINKFVEPLLQGVIVSFGLGFIVVFVAIIVTSSIVPDTFKSSSLHLMLSKPISRVWLFLSRFFGSCFFVLINISLVITGLYLIAGFRLDIWNEGLFWCIPLLLFVFIIFYSVSSLTGLLWGNAIVCVISCILFWLLCFVVGMVRDVTRNFAEVYPQIGRIEAVQDEVFAIDGFGRLTVWNNEYSVWQPALEDQRFGPTLTVGPVYAEEYDKLLFKSFPRQRNSNNRNIEIVELKGVSDLAGDSTAESADEEDAPQSDESAAAEDEANSSAAEEPDTDDALAINNADEARQSGRWSSESGPAIPAKVFSMQIVGDKVLAICRSGLYELDMEKLELIGQTEKSLFGFQLPFAKTTAFNKISPPDLFLSENATVAAVAGESSIVVFNSGAVDWLELQDDKFVSVANIRLEGDVTAPAQMAATADFVLIARQDLPIVVLDRQLKELKTDLELPDKGKVRQLEAIPNTNKFAAVTRSGDVWQMDTASMSFERIEQPFTNNCTSMRWIDENTVWLSHSPNVLGLVDLSEQKVLKELAPTPSTLESVFGWIINPIYIALPKPSSLSQTMQYVLTGEDTIALDQSSAVSAQVELDVWTPIIHNVLFVLSVLAVCCVYVARKEF